MAQKYSKTVKKQPTTRNSQKHIKKFVLLFGRTKTNAYLCIAFEKQSIRDVVQLVERLVWDQEVACSNRVIPTKAKHSQKCGCFCFSWQANTTQFTSAMGRNQYFRFRQFTIWQDRCAMKVGTDGVLLGAWATVQESPSRILDIGTGTGLIVLMAAQRSPESELFAVEIDPEAAAQARENVQASSWADRITVITGDINQLLTTDLANRKFNHILCNPPYFRNSLKCPSEGRTTARHATNLSFDELAAAASSLLSDQGTFSVIIPSEACSDFISSCTENSLLLTRMTDVFTKPNGSPRRALLEFTRPTPQATLPQEQPLVTSLTVGSDDHASLVSPFLGTGS